MGALGLNVLPASWQALAGDEAAMDVGATALAGAELTNGLECKITCETSKARAPACPVQVVRAKLGSRLCSHQAQDATHSLVLSVNTVLWADPARTSHGTRIARDAAHHAIP